jgi:DnaK suppressor protein
MNKLDIKHFKQLLLKRRKQLLEVADSGREAAETVELDQARVGRLSRMDALQQQAMAQATSQRRDQELRRIAAALVRVESDDFGYCLECDEEIARGRLEFDPSVTVCIDCAESSS